MIGSGSGSEFQNVEIYRCFIPVLRIWNPDPSDPYGFGLLNPDPDPLVRGMDPGAALDPDPFIIKQKNKKKLDSYCFVTSFSF
jgi:hypothetical protein